MPVICAICGGRYPSNALLYDHYYRNHSQKDVAKALVKKSDFENSYGGD